MKKINGDTIDTPKNQHSPKHKIMVKNKTESNKEVRNEI